MTDRARIGRAGVADIETVLGLVTDLLHELGAEDREFSGSDMTGLGSVLEKRLRHGRLVALLARDERGEAVGILTLTEGFAIYAGGRYGIIDEMYVRPSLRGTGVGTALLQRAVSLATERGWSRLDVATPEEDTDTHAGDYYRRRGFRFSGEKLRLPLA